MRVRIELKGVTKVFGQRGTTDQGASLTALGPLDLTIEPGQFVCVVGPTGCGKSTLLNLIAGHDAPSAGTVTINAAPAGPPGPDRMLLFQESALFPWLTVRGNVEFPLRSKAIPVDERRARVNEILRTVHLARVAERYPHELSGGMRQRTAIARALVSSPRVLLMDEPFAALDAQTRELLHREVEQLWLAMRPTVLFITHNVREAVRLGDRVFVMSARPGRFIREIHVALSRPRDEESKNLVHFTQLIVQDLRVEIDKVTREEMGHDYEPPKDRVPPHPHRDVGRGI